MLVMLTLGQNQLPVAGMAEGAQAPGQPLIYHYHHPEFSGKI